jgi:signal transduction histidine kinase
VHSHQETIWITIEDSGGGIAEEIIDRVFEPYFSSKSKNGTGLGLYMAKMIIDNHINGTLDVENTGKGARFTIGLPKK